MGRVPAVLPLILSFFSFVLLILAVFFAWFTVDGGGTTVSYDWFGGSSDDTDSSWGDMFPNSSRTKNLCATTLVLLIFAILLNLAFFVCSISLHRPGSIGFLQQDVLFSVIFCLGAMVVSFAAIISYCAAFPVSYHDDCAENQGGLCIISTFSGSRNIGGATIEWGPGIGWIFGALATGVLFIAAQIPTRIFR